MSSSQLILGTTVFLLGLIGFVSTRPDTFAISREQRMKASKSKVWKLLADFSQWKRFNYFQIMDPTQTSIVRHEPFKEGHRLVYRGDHSGEGSLTIVSIIPESKFEIKLEFYKPMPDTATVLIEVLEVANENVEVKWTMKGKTGFKGKFFNLIYPFEKMIGGAYEATLLNLKKIVESEH